MEINGHNYCSRCMRETAPGSVCPHCGYDGSPEQNPQVLEEGTLLNGKYQLGALIGKGGFGITYAAWDENLDRPVAVKEYFPQDFVTRNVNQGDEVVCLDKYETHFLAGRLRFERESHLLAALREIPNVVRVLDYFSENNTAYIVMEYIRGVSLEAWLKSHQLRQNQALALIRPVVDALVLLHQQGVVHRDLKPDNIMVQEDGTLRLIDFGAAMETERNGGTIILSRGYAPAEQYGREYGRQGPWSDVYGMAAVIYQLLTGQVPQEALLRLKRDELKSPAALGVRLRKKQNAALMDALAVQPEKRTQSMEEFRAGLYLLPMPEQVLWRRRMRRRLLIASCAVLLLAAALIANFTWGLPVSRGLRCSLRRDGWHILGTWGKADAQRELPERVLGVPVTAVERDAFREDTALTKITVPASVQSIGDQAFYGCSGLRETVLNGDLREIGLSVFDGTPENMLIWGRRDGVQDAYAQSNHLLFADSGEMVFEETEGGLVLTRLDTAGETLVIPSYVGGKPVTGIDGEVRIKKAAEVWFPDELAAIPATICENNGNLRAVHIGKHTERIGEGAFSGCGRLSEVFFGEALRAVEPSAFSQCASLTDLTLPEGLAEIGDKAFSGCSSLSRLVMPDTVEKMGGGVFSQCASLRELRLSERLTEIPEQAFRGCGLPTVRLPGGVTSVGAGAFRESGLEWLCLPAGVKTLGASIFADCSSLQWVEFLCDNAELAEGAAAYSELTGFPDDLVVGGHPGTAAEWIARECGAAFEDLSGWSDCFELAGECAVLTQARDILRVPWFNEKENCPVTYTKGVSGTQVREITLSRFQTRVTDSEFANCAQLQKVDCPGGLEEIGIQSFADCGSLQKVGMKNSPRIIGADAFGRDRLLTEIDLSGTYWIGAQAFIECQSLTQLTLSDGLTGIGEWAFLECGVRGLTVPGSLTIIPDSAFTYMPADWVILSEGCKEISKGGMDGCLWLTKLVLPAGMRQVRDEALLSEKAVDIWVYQPDMIIDDLAFYKLTPRKDETWEELYRRLPPPVIHGWPGSTAEAYAREHGFTFVEITETYEELTAAIRAGQK